MKQKILCIDDIKTNLFTLESVIESATDDKYEVFLAESADAGFEVLLKNKIDIILLDVMMPDIDGFEAAKMIKSRKKTKNIPIIFVTAKKDDDTIEECYNVGGVDYINKPFNTSELMNRISFHLDLIENKKQLETERSFTQNILDMQDNMIVVSDSTRAIHINKAVKDFFNISSLDEFYLRTVCISDFFVKEDGFFSVDTNDTKGNWVEYLLSNLDDKDELVKIIFDSKTYVFTIKVSKLDKYYILSFTDVTYMSNKTKEFEYGANFDALTQIYNRNMFNKIMENKIKYATVTNDYHFVFMIFDIDYFKKVNDTYGHIKGDEVLKSIVKIIKQHIRSDDLFARWGGEEFVLSFDVNIQRGVEIAENLRKNIEAYKYEDVERITCSFGVTEYKKGDTLLDLLSRADKALYEAKESGRNRVCQA
jgi:diguanylate cyclase (GGDEF)-like protein